MQEEMKTIREVLEFYHGSCQHDWADFLKVCVDDQNEDGTHKKAKEGLTALNQLEAKKLITEEEYNEAITIAYMKGQNDKQKEWQAKLDSEEVQNKVDAAVKAEFKRLLSLDIPSNEYEEGAIAKAAIKAIKEAL